MLIEESISCSEGSKCKMDQIKEKCLKILLEIDYVCNKAGLKYYLYAGSLLGAIRHEGFIPWDDDIDIVMMREDYEKFPKACEQYLNCQRFELQTIDSDLYASNPWMKLHDKNTAFISGIRRQGAMEGINIDIFPLDNVPDSKRRMKVRAFFVDKLNFIYQYRFQEHSKQASIKMKLFQSLIIVIPPWDEMRFKKLYDKYIQKYNDRKTENVVYLSNRNYLRKVISRRCFDETVMLPFENSYFPAPSGWDDILVGLYGKNYMQLPPEDQRVTVHGTVVIDLEHSWKTYKRGTSGYEKV